MLPRVIHGKMPHIFKCNQASMRLLFDTPVIIACQSVLQVETASNPVPPKCYINGANRVAPRESIAHDLVVISISRIP